MILMLSPASDDSHAFTGKCVGQSLSLSLEYTAGVHAVLGGLIACTTDRTECQVHKKYSLKWVLSSEHSIGLTFTRSELDKKCLCVAWT